MTGREGRAGPVRGQAGAPGGLGFGDHKQSENTARPTDTQHSYSPWNIRLQYERVIALAELRALVRVLAGPAGAEAVDAITEAMRRPDDPAALDWAQVEFERLPRRQFRRVLSTFAALRWGGRP